MYAERTKGGMPHVILLWAFWAKSHIGPEFWAYCAVDFDKRNICICLGPLCWACHLDLSIRIGPWESPFNIGPWWAQWDWVIYGPGSGYL